MMSCKHASRLISEAMDRRLTALERLSLRYHLVVCGICRRYRRQLLLIREALMWMKSSQGGVALPSSLSPDARERIRQAILRRAGD